MSAFDAFDRAFSQMKDQPNAAFEGLAALTDALIGVRLLTLMTFDAASREAKRIYSNMPDAYPVLGTKPVNETYWTKRVLDQQQTFVANDIEGIAEVFSDFELIQSLGCESVLNLPITIAGSVVGTVNCLHQADHYTPERVAASSQIKRPGAA